jgi:hypothetical protein
MIAHFPGLVQARHYIKSGGSKYTLENTEGAIEKGQPKETGNIGHTRRIKTHQSQNLICVGHHSTQANTNKVNKTCVLLQTTGGKDESNINFMRKSYWISQHGTQNVKTHNRTTQKN